ncbi:thioesterase family protein [Kitasatospora sp. NPDC059722]|uniref:thioesterase family protein n=1 Tax=unclassified Kitasatospora TaxID=2633591 RepID=UPI003677DD31
MNDSYFERTGERRFKPTVHAGGAWNDDELHFSPVGGLVVHAIERHRAQTGAAGGLALSRIAFDILGRLAVDECEITVETIRPGRTVELVEAVLVIGERAVIRARAWYLATSDTSAVAGSPVEPLAGPGEFEPWPMSELWDGGYIASIDVRRRELAQGRAQAWIGSEVGLVAGEEIGPLASFVALVDTANGIAVRQDHTEWMFPNVDLTIHLHRQPEGRWTGMDTTVTFGPTGHGLTSTVLHDVHGPVGSAQQSLTVRSLGVSPGA